MTGLIEKIYRYYVHTLHGDEECGRQSWDVYEKLAPEDKQQTTTQHQ